MYNGTLWDVGVTIVAMERATIITLFVAGIVVAAIRMKVCSVAVQMQEWIPFPMLSNCKIFRTAVNSYNF
jgi:hypothetical protein